MRVSDAVTQADGLGITLILFAILYAVLGVTCIYVLVKMFKDKSAEEEKISWYGESGIKAEDGSGGRLLP